MSGALCGAVYGISWALSVGIQLAVQSDPSQAATLGSVSPLISAGLCIAGCIMRNKFRTEKDINGNLIEDFLCASDHNLPCRSQSILVVT